MMNPMMMVCEPTPDGTDRQGGMGGMGLGGMGMMNPMMMVRFVIQR
jgi:hypothetical protein